MKSKLLLITIALVAITIKAQSQASGTFTDSRDGKTYKTITIGSQTWMAENLNYITEAVAFCYDDSFPNCDKYGRLYNWSTAKNACPNGWHLPTKNEFDTLISHVGNYGAKGYKALKVGGRSGFDGLLGGYCTELYEYNHIEYCGYWWLSSESNEEKSWYFYIMHGSATRYFTSKNDFLSVRCIKD